MMRTVGAILGVGVVVVAGGVWLMGGGGDDAELLATDAKAPAERPTMTVPEAPTRSQPSAQFAMGDGDGLGFPEDDEGRGGRRFGRGEGFGGPGGRGGPGGPGGFMRGMDTDGDGVVTEAEWAARYDEMQARRREFEAPYDLDGDGKLSLEERRAQAEAMRAGFEARMRERFTPRFDADGDGVLNAEEQAAMDAAEAQMRARWDERLLPEYDLDKDGVLSDSERKAAQDAEFTRRMNQQQEFIARFDRNGDGDLNIDESYNAFTTMNEERQANRFMRRFDADEDGTLGVGDFESFAAMHSAGDERADTNGDGVVNNLDLEIFRDRMLQQP